MKKRLNMPIWFFIILIILDVVLVAEFSLIAWARIKNINNEICIYNDTDFYGIKIPQEIDLIFADELYSDNGDSRKVGGYNKYDMRIRVQLPRRSFEQIQATLTHELMHHEYHYNLSKQEKQRIVQVYDLFCKGPNEFYAYTVGNYGRFKW